MRATALPQSTGATAAAGQADTAQLPAADEALMLAYARGDLASFEELYSRHERPLYRFLLRSVRVPSVADELLQEVFLSVIRSAPHYEARARFTTWLYRIARNRLVDHWRSSDAAAWQSVNDVDGHEVSLIDNLVADASGQPEHIALDRGRARDLARALEDLPAAQRETFLLHVEAGLSIEQISTVTGCPHESIKSRFRYACAKLRARMSHWSQP